MAGTILFAGGGTGGHLFPSIAVAQRLRRIAPRLESHFACSNRALDLQILSDADVAYTPLSVQPLPAVSRPWEAPGFIKSYFQSRAMAETLIANHGVSLVVAMGGFVSGPVVGAARRRGVPTVLVNLDAVPGKANRLLAGRCDRLFTVYETSALPERAERLALPLRSECLAPADAAECRRRLELDPAQPVLLVTGASQGAESINRMMIELTKRAAMQGVLRPFSIVHLAGAEREEAVSRAYKAAGLTAKVMAFTHEMGLCWGAAELAISRAGANSVAEAAANGVPTIFMPYPYHKDQHQRVNAQPLVEAGGAVMWDDLREGPLNANRYGQALVGLLQDSQRRAKMRAKLNEAAGGDGAQRLAQIIVEMVGEASHPAPKQAAA